MSENEKHVPEIYEIDNLREEISNFPPYYKRSYIDRYCVAYSKENFYLDVRIQMHASRMCLLFIADGHSAIQDYKTVKRLEFNINGKDRLKEPPKGKFKKNSQQLHSNSVVCYIETDDGVKYPLCACIPCKLFDVNTVVVQNPHKLIEEYNTTGYIVMIFPKNFKDSREKILEGFLTREEYEKVLASRIDSKDFKPPIF